MSKFNQPRKPHELPGATRNYEGGLAFEKSPMQELYSLVCTALMGENKFYESGVKEDERLLHLIAQVAQDSPEFILKLAAYARNKMYLRSVPVVLLVEASEIPECKPFVRKWTPHILRRADEPQEAIAYWISRKGDVGSRGKNPFPNSLKKGIADAFLQFDEYQIDKYNRGGAVTMRDVLRICHPKPQTAKQDALFSYIIDPSTFNPELLPKINMKKKFLKSEDFNKARQYIADGSITWEVALSKFGNRAEVWNELDLPIMATLRNLRNIIESGAEDAKQKAYDKLMNDEIIRRSKQLPFRFFSAYKSLAYTIGADKMLSALSYALEVSTKNLPTLPGKTLIMCDNSGSMSHNISGRSNVTCSDIANILGAMSNRFSEDALVVSFATSFSPVALNPADSILSNMDKIANVSVGYGTDAHKVIDWIIQRDLAFDRIIILSDMQCYSSSFKDDSLFQSTRKYVSKYGALPIYSVDLAGYCTAQFPEELPSVFSISGWSERIFDYIARTEEGPQTAIEEIKAMQA